MANLGRPKLEGVDAWKRAALARNRAENRERSFSHFHAIVVKEKNEVF